MKNFVFSLYTVVWSKISKILFLQAPIGNKSSLLEQTLFETPCIKKMNPIYKKCGGDEIGPQRTMKYIFARVSNVLGVSLIRDLDSLRCQSKSYLQQHCKVMHLHSYPIRNIYAPNVPIHAVPIKTEMFFCEVYCISVVP